MIDIPDLAVVGLAAGTLSAFALGGGLLRSGRHRARQREEIAALRSTLGQETSALRSQLDRETAALRSRLDEARQESGRTAEALTAEVVHLAKERIPAEATRAAHPHVRVPGPLHPELTGADLDSGLRDVLAGVLAAMAQERKRVDAAA